MPYAEHVRVNCPGPHRPVAKPNGAPTTSWPDALNFVHVDVVTGEDPLPEFSTSSAFGSGLGQPISPALHDAFLPERKNFVLTQLNSPQCACRNRLVLPGPRKDLLSEPPIDLHPQTLQLSAAQLGGGNLQRERMLRQQQVLDIIKEEPPRRTVTNSFRVH